MKIFTPFAIAIATAATVGVAFVLVADTIGARRARGAHAAAVHACFAAVPNAVAAGGRLADARHADEGRAIPCEVAGASSAAAGALAAAAVDARLGAILHAVHPTIGAGAPALVRDACELGDRRRIGRRPALNARAIQRRSQLDLRGAELEASHVRVAGLIAEARGGLWQTLHLGACGARVPRRMAAAAGQTQRHRPVGPDMPAPTTAIDRPGMFPVRIIVATALSVPAGGVPVEIRCRSAVVVVCMACSCLAG